MKSIWPLRTPPAAPRGVERAGPYGRPSRQRDPPPGSHGRPPCRGKISSVVRISGTRSDGAEMYSSSASGRPEAAISSRAASSWAAVNSVSLRDASSGGGATGGGDPSEIQRPSGGQPVDRRKVEAVFGRQEAAADPHLQHDGRRIVRQEQVRGGCGCRRGSRCRRRNRGTVGDPESPPQAAAASDAARPATRHHPAYRRRFMTVPVQGTPGEAGASRAFLPRDIRRSSAGCQRSVHSAA